MSNKVFENSATAEMFIWKVFKMQLKNIKFDNNFKYKRFNFINKIVADNLKSILDGSINISYLVNTLRKKGYIDNQEFDYNKYSIQEFLLNCIINEADIEKIYKRIEHAHDLSTANVKISVTLEMFYLPRKAIENFNNKGLEYYL